jgi:hypothetical protein
MLEQETLLYPQVMMMIISFTQMKDTLSFKLCYPLTCTLISLQALFHKVHWARLRHFFHYMCNVKTT